MMKRVLLLSCFFLLALRAPAQLFDARKSYEISTPDGWVLDVGGAVQTDTPLFLSRREAGNASQVWQIRPLGKGAYQLVNGHSNLGLDSDGSGEHPVLQWGDEPGNPNQRWLVSRRGDGTYILSRENGAFALGLDREAAEGRRVWQVKADPESPLQHWIIRESATKLRFIDFKTSSSNDWENPAVIGIGKEPGHPTLIPYAV